MPKVTVTTEHETYTYDQCDAMFCIASKHEGTRHVDSTGHTWDESEDQED